MSGKTEEFMELGLGIVEFIDLNSAYRLHFLSFPSFDYKMAAFVGQILNKGLSQNR